MNILPEVTFSRIMFYATEKHRYLKKAVSWEAVSKKFSILLKRFFKYDVRSIFIDLMLQRNGEILVTIQEYEDHGVIDLRVLKGYGVRVPESKIEFRLHSLPGQFGLPVGFASVVPPPSSVVFGLGMFDMNARFDDAEFVELLTLRRSNIRTILIRPSNAKLPDRFTDAIKNLTALEKFELKYGYSAHTMAFDTGIELLRTVGYTKPKCVILNNYRSTPNVSKKIRFAKELFILLENCEIQCLHLEEMEDWIAAWLNDSSLRNRAKIRTLCITAEYERRSTLLWHPISDYKILFPCVQNICLRIEFKIDDNSFDKLISSYFDNDYKPDIRVYLTVHLLHKLKQFPSARLEYLYKLEKHGVHVENEKINETDAKFTVRSKYDKIVCLVLVCFDSNDLFASPASITTRLDRNHSDDDLRCLCVRKQ